MSWISPGMFWYFQRVEPEDVSSNEFWNKLAIDESYPRKP